MSYQAAGTGFITYQIANEQAVNNPSCSVQVLEDDAAGMLTMSVSFTDNTYGKVQVGITVFNYSPATTNYSDVAYLMIGFHSESPQGGWVSSSGSSVSFFVQQSATSGSASYTGSFDAENLTWTGSGSQDSLAIKFGTYNFTVTNTSVTDPNRQDGAGTGSVAYTLGTAASLTEQASAITALLSVNNVPEILWTKLMWTDPVQGDIQLIVTICPFSGSSGQSSNSAQSFSVALYAANAGKGCWSNTGSSVVDGDPTYTVQGNLAQFSGSLQATGLTSPVQPDMDLNLSAFSFTLNLG